MERIALAREYRVAQWLRDAYLELTQKMPLDLEELRPAEPYPEPLDRNWEADAKKWEATSRDWETLARIFHLQTVAASTRIKSIPVHTVSAFGQVSQVTSDHRCDECGLSYSSGWLCECRVLPMVNEAFRGELEGLREDPGHVEHPLTRKLHAIIIFVSVENNFVQPTAPTAQHSLLQYTEFQGRSLRRGKNTEIVASPSHFSHDFGLCTPK
jgi:hypothetical protein